MALWPAKMRALDRIGRAAARRCSQQNRRQHCGGGQKSLVALVHELAHDVALRDVRGLVRQHARQFIFIARRHDQAAVDGHEAAGDGRRR